VIRTAILFSIFVLVCDAQFVVVTPDGFRLPAKVVDGHVATYDGLEWKPHFWTGVNIGATTPGHFPGELSVSKEDYARWFRLIKDMNVRVVRVYTILPPGFYQALVEFNRTQADPLWVMHGIWAPEEELIGTDERGRNAYSADITAKFRAEIVDAVRAIHGDLVRTPQPGHASGVYDADISPYLLGYLVGTEWYPYAVTVTNQDAAGEVPYQGKYFNSTADASPFESWLAQMLDQVAVEDMRYGWQHPMAFVAWLTTDPLSHPGEPNSQEDLVSVDPNHVSPTAAWQAGYYAAYHVYPYYPDFLRYDSRYQSYRDAAGNINPYAGYLHELRAYHKGIPLFVAEFGVPASRGLAHRSPTGWNQGSHTEAEQGEMDAAMTTSIFSEGYDGAVLFSWQDEWYKFSWNTVDLEQPFDRRPFWLNRLTNERFFGVLAMDPASNGVGVTLDGRGDEWATLPHKQEWQYPALDLAVSHDEAYVYLKLRKRSTAWDFSRDQVYVGFSTLPGGSRTSDQAPGLSFSQPMQFLLRIRGDDDAVWSVLSAYDQHTYRWSVQYPVLPSNLNYSDPSLGMFLPWKLLLSRPLVLPESGESIPAEEVEIGLLKRGTADPNSSDNNDLADWQYQGDTIEVRIPWMLLGFMDPSSRSVWDWPYVAQGFKPVPTGGIQVEPKLVTHGQEIANDGPPAVYQWSTWDVPAYRERLKAGYSILTNVLGVYAALQPRNQSPDPEAATSLAKRGTSPVRTMIPKDPRSAEWRRTHPR
jgi:hypothetical protein